ncbi:transketolase [Microbispora cellulosiformans]|uniref:Dihydrolipoamide acetyltransferase component of pyruvate dehydrogenase complex n=1 Tax=Microbispora cellulosiformans TaxID=2614688 RepID=A0A5J5K8L6_9ACTN|nr:2-oxo acid dehydrogenase subunit E2 [Microbispora cellulosiformans]KAA9381331.1 transketolase [Microbispora cellulosiformans]
MTPLAPRLAESLNGALHRLFAERPGLHLLGEDVADPYGGAFKVTRGLSDRHPGRVLSTPISENGLAGVAAGLALAGDEVVAEVMFGDFAALVFDPVLNLISKSVTMYGRRLPMPVVLRCPVGGRRGYGPTHSQSVQKHFVGMPNLALYELSPFHDPYGLLAHALDHGPALLFEDKVLYTRRAYADGVVDEHFRSSLTGDAAGWAHVTPVDGAAPDVVLLCPGGVAHRALAAAHLLRERGVTAHLLVPGRLYPLDIEPVLPLLERPALVAVAEESTAGGTWGSDIAALVYERLWPRLRAPVLRLSSADSIIPAARHLEDRVLLGERHIAEAVADRLGTLAAPAARSVAEPVAEVAAESVSVPLAVPLVVPKLNSNDTHYLVTGWLAEDGARVEAGAPLVELETSKAVEEIEAPAAGYLRISAGAGTEVEVGAVIAELHELAPPLNRAAGSGPGSEAPATIAAYATAGGGDEPPAAPAQAAQPAQARPPAEPSPADQRTYVLDRVQRGTAAVVSRAHKEVPAAFTAVEVCVDALLARLRLLSEESGAEVGVPEAVVKAVAAVHDRFGHLFGSLVDDRTVALAETPHVAVTIDAGRGLYTPVIRDCASRSIADIADDLMDFRMKAWRGGDFTTSELDGGTITISINTEADVVFVQPIVMWPQLCMLSVGGLRRQLALHDGVLATTTVVVLGLAYDHRVVNGAEAVAFLRAVADNLREPDRLDQLVA